MFFAIRAIIDFIVYLGVLTDTFTFICMLVSDTSKNSTFTLILIIMGKVVINMMFFSAETRLSKKLGLSIKFLSSLMLVGYLVYYFPYGLLEFYIIAITIESFTLLCLIIYIYNFNKWTTILQEYYDCQYHNEECEECRCSICLESYNNQDIYILHCRHSFHRDCLNEWIKQKPNCPLCRLRIILE